MVTKTEPPRSETLQLWPSGKTVEYRGDPHGPNMQIRRGNRWRKSTAEERRAVRVEVLARRFQERDVWCCDSSLVSELMRNPPSGDLGDAFDMSEVVNLRAEPSDWTIEQCKEWLEDKGEELPEPNPWAMDRATLIEALHGKDAKDANEADQAIIDDASDDLLRESLIEAITDKTHDGIDAWRDAVSEAAPEHEDEVYEWWRVSGMLADALKRIGEPVLDNGYGTWWGRTCTGQSMMMDGTLQKIAARFAD